MKNNNKNELILHAGVSAKNNIGVTYKNKIQEATFFKIASCIYTLNNLSFSDSFKTMYFSTSMSFGNLSLTIGSIN